MIQPELFSGPTGFEDCSLSMISGNIRLLWKRKSTSSLKLRFKVSKAHFLIEVDKETENPELRAEGFIDLPFSPRSQTLKVRDWLMLLTQQNYIRLS